jgi:sulfite reductase (ferredoxin)
VEYFRPEVRLTPSQDVLLCNLPASALPAIERRLDAFGIPKPERLSNVQKLSLACPAIPTCGLAICEAERALPAILDELELALQELGLEQEAIGIRMTGCPNGCVRPYQSDIGIVGRSGDKYMLFVGGHRHGDRLNFELIDLVPRGQIVSNLMPLLRHFKTNRHTAEGFGDFCQRLGVERLRALLAARTAASA